MPTVTSGGILSAWATRIEALVPASRVGEDDRFRVVVGLRTAVTGSRAVLLTAQAGRRLQSGRTCSDWECVALCEVWYLDNSGAYATALDDAEAIAADLYDWVSSNDGENLGLLQVEPELANIVGADGELQVLRQVRFVYRGLP
ncbi:MAG: hypothetical protein FJ191_12680 [Gammaproteobacteria bacterium]|nr:hypothetical protein [Gammaproteobacteria bacterium]